MSTGPLFYVAEVNCYRPGSTTLTVAQGHGATPRGTIAQFPDELESSSTLLVSDMGYRTLSTDPFGLQIYPPQLSQAFAVDRRMNFDPNAPVVAAAWGSLTIANPNSAFDAIAATWNCDGREVRILWGNKILEDFGGYQTGRATTGTYIDSSDALQSAAAGVVRYDWSTGSMVALNEPTRTNSLRNSTMVGVAAGTPGTLPTNWSTTFAGTRTISGPSTEDGITYIDIRFQGATNTGFALEFEGTTQIAALQNQAWTSSFYCKLVAGSLSGVTLQNAIAPTNSGGGALTQGIVAISPSGASLSLQRFVQTYTLPDATTAFVRSRIRVPTLPSSYDFTLRIGGVQVEQGSSATSFFPTSTAAATRAADNLVTARGILLDPSYTTLGNAFIGVATPWFLSDTELQVPLRDASYWTERPLQTNQYLGTGTYEGTSELTGTPKPKARGGTSVYPIRNVSPVLVDPTNRIYQYSDAAGTVVNLYEGGAFTINWASNTTNLYVGTTPAGQYRTDNSRGLFQLGSTPVATITADVTGAFPAAGAVSNPARIAQYLLTEDLALPSGNIDTSSFDFLATTYAYTGGVYFGPNDSPDGATAVGRVLGGFGACLIPSRWGALRGMALRTIPSGTTPAATYDTTNIVSLTPLALPNTLDPPPYRIRVAYQKNYTNQSSGFLGSATDHQKQFVAKDAYYSSWSSTAVLTSYRRPNDSAPVGGVLTAGADAQAVANDLGALWGVRRRLYAIVLPAQIALVREFGDVVMLRYPMDNLTSGQLGQIVGEQFRSGDPTITLLVLV